MPWWGYLITAVVAFILTAWVAVAVLGFRAARAVKREVLGGIDKLRSDQR